MPKQSIFKVWFGGLLSAVSFLNKIFGWFRSFDWLKSNAPSVWSTLVNPAVEYTIIVGGLVLAAVGLREIWKFRQSPRSDSTTPSAATHGHQSPINTAGRDIIQNFFQPPPSAAADQVPSGHDEVTERKASRGGPELVIDYEYEENTRPWPPPDKNNKPQAPLTVRNISSEPAYNVVLRPLEINGAVTAFDPPLVSYIENGKPVNIVARITGGSPLFRDRLPYFLRQSYEDKSVDELMSEKSFYLTLDYDDGKHPASLYTTTCELKYRRWHDLTVMGRVQRQLRAVDGEPDALLQETPLRFHEWHSGSSRAYPQVSIGQPSWVSVVNQEVKVPKTAKNVISRVEFKNDAGTLAIPSTECAWYEKRDVNGIKGEGWVRTTDIEAGDDQSFVLFVLDKNSNDIFVCGTNFAPIATLAPGHWTAHIFVESDNLLGFQGTIGFTLSKHGLVPDRPAFTKLFSVEPRLKSL